MHITQIKSVSVEFVRCHLNPAFKISVGTDAQTKLTFAAAKVRKGFRARPYIYEPHGELQVYVCVGKTDILENFSSFGERVQSWPDPSPKEPYF